MSSKKNTFVHFVGNNASDVTGSCTIIKHNNYRIAVDMGLIQTNNIVADYRANKEQIKKIKVKNINACIITHLHNDHIGGLLVGVHSGMNCNIYIPENSSTILRIMLEDCAKIMESDALRLQQKHGTKVASLATKDDVEKAMQYIVEVPFNQWYKILPDINIKYYHAGHIVNSAQVVIDIKDGYVHKRIGFTGDIGVEDKGKSVHHIQNIEEKLNILVGECTYSDKTRSYSMKKDRWYDEITISTVLNQYQKVLCPVFSLQRLEDILECLCKLGIKKKIYVDAPLGIKIYKNWVEELNYERKLNITFINDWEESLALQNNKDENCLIIASSGMLNAGRAVSHLKTLLPHSNNAILFVGYSAENTTATEIKHGTRDIKVDGEIIPNRAQIYCLNSFSSHANYFQLIEYYEQQNFDKLCLVHSEFNDKCLFAKDLEERIHKMGISARVISSQQDQKIYL